MLFRLVRAAIVCPAFVLALGQSFRADTTAQTLAFSQDWSDISLITTDGNWSSVPGIVGYRGDGLVNATGVNPQTVLADGASPVDVNANQTSPNTFTTGGAAGFHLTNPVVAFRAVR
jgi:uncharacterized protein